MNEEHPTDKIVNNAAAMLGEHFQDYLILVRADGGIAARYTDQSWSIGAVDRFKLGRN